MLNPIAGKASLGIKEWQMLLVDLLGFSLDLTQREARFAFWLAKMTVVDEVQKRHKLMTLSWVEFLEAVGRVADSISIPTDEDLASLGAANIMDFEARLGTADVATQARMRKPRPSSDFAAPKTRPLSLKLDRLLRLIIGRTALACKGTLSVGGKRYNLVGTYVTREQLRTMSVLRR